MQRVRTYSQRLTNILSSPKFFWGIVALLILQAAWIALSSRYPMAFDEEFHFGLIRLYADHLSPFWSSHPAGGDAFGALTRDPSYLYHYLMAFPYKLISFFTDSQAAQVLLLRGLNIGFLVGGLILYRRLLFKTAASAAVVHFCLLVFVLVPIVPLLAAQINYDNLILPLTAWALLLTFQLVSSFKKQSFNAPVLLLWLVVCLFASLVKYAFLPAFAAMALYVLVSATRRYPVRGTGQMILTSFKRIGPWSATLLIGALIILSGLFVERYAVNLVRYQTPVVDCGDVLSYDHCRHYGPWIRDYNLTQNKAANAERSPLVFTADWFHGMWLRSMFAVDGPLTDFQTRGPLAIPGVSVIVFASTGVLALLIAAPKVWRRYRTSVLWLFIGVSALHVAVLWLQQYQMFLETGIPVAINGRYLLPILPLLLIMTVLAVNELLGRRHGLKAGLAMIVLICFLWGGGGLTYILRSNDSWYWNNSHVRRINHAVKAVAGPLTPGYRQPTLFIR